MSDTVYVTSGNPVNFLLEFAKEVKAGYYADESRHSMPRFDIVNDVHLTKGEKPSQRNDFSTLEKVYIQSYSEILFILDVQDAIVQGFEVDESSVDISGLSPLFSVLMVKPSKEEKPKAPQVAGKAHKADPVGVPALTEEEGPEAITEAPKPAPRKGGRPPKVTKEA